MKKLIFPIFAIIALAFLTSSCDDSKSYAELLADENYVVNDFLVRHHVVNYVPSDSVFISRRDIAEKMYEESGQTAADEAAYEQAIVEIMASLEKIRQKTLLIIGSTMTQTSTCRSFLSVPMKNQRKTTASTSALPDTICSTMWSELTTL